MNPKNHLAYYSRIYPSAWKQVDQFRADRGKSLPFWPDWCFLPLAGAYAIIMAEAKAQGVLATKEEILPLMNDVSIDSDVYAEVIKTPISGDLPYDILFNLPEWCVYIETPGLAFLERPLTGFFAFLEYDVNNGDKELRIVADYTTPEHKTPFLISHTLHLGDCTLLEAVERSIKEAESQMKKLFNEKASFGSIPAKYIQKNHAALVSLLLYICSVNSEIGDDDRKPAKPKPVKTKKGPRLFPPMQPSVWDVGVRMGAVLRRARRQAEEGVKLEAGEGQRRKSPRPHVRTAHWHGYWTGPRENQKFEVRWMPPIPVMVAKDGDLPVTIRPVK
jgi:hypothetical protein